MHSRITKRPASLLSLAAAMTATVGLATVQPALAQQAGTQMQSEARQHFDIPAGSMTAALNALARQTGLALTFDPDLTQGKTSQGLSGDYTVSEALRAILAGSGLSHRFTGPDSVILRPALRSDVVELSTVLVEGHRLNVYEEIHANEEKRLHSLRPDLILGSEQMQRFPDEHIGKALDRMPGMFSTSPAEKQEVRVRGLDKEFTRVELDGVNIPGSNRWRNLSLGTVATSLVDEVRVIRNPTADIEHDGIGGRVSIRYRRAPEQFEGRAQVMGGQINEGDGEGMFAGRASIWAGGPVTDDFSMLGGLDINGVPHRRAHRAVEENADGSFRELFERSDRKDVNRVSAFTKFGWTLDRTYLELEPLLMAESLSVQDERRTTEANGRQDNRFRSGEDSTRTYGGNFRWEHELGEQWQTEGRVSAFRSDQNGSMDEVRLRYHANGDLRDQSVTRTNDELTDDMLELRSALSYSWDAAGLGKAEFGVQARRNERDGTKTVIENGEAREPGSGDEYSLREDYLAGWLRQQFLFFDDRLRVEPGVRIEDYRLTARSNDGEGGSVHQGSDNLHVGPSLHAAWQLSPEFTLHGAVSRTQNRPQLDQITPSRVQRGREIIVGNPELASSTSVNSDLGLVWSTPDAFLAATLFHKDIDDLIVNARTGEQEGNRDVVQPRNIERGTLRGLELEQRLHLGLTGIDLLEGVHLWSNQTLFDGSMRLQSGREVPFFGEPDYLVAAGIDWISPRSGMQLSLAASHNGKRTEEDEFSRKRFDSLTTVDLTGSYPISPTTRVRFEASNLFNEQESGPKAFFDQDGELSHTEYRTVSIPRTLWLGIEARF
jgi:outer membrane receptor for ferrienterochelin and colicins